MAEKIGWGWAGPQYTAHIWVRYRLTLEKFNDFWHNQEGKCAGCQTDLAHPKLKEIKTGLKPEVDHCHKTGKVRGLLCRRCNDFLGKIQDDRAILLALQEYLKRNGDWE